jgi:transposase
LPIKLIARTLGISRNTVRAALASEGPPKYVRKPVGSAVDAFEDAIRAQLKDVPTMPATVIAERVGWTRGITVFKERVRELRPAYLPPDPAGRTTYDAGDIAQCDLWFPPATVPVGYGQTRSPMQLPVLSMVCGYSRWLSAILIPSRRSEDLFAGWWQLIAALGAVPRTLVWDGEGAIGRWRSGRTELTRDCQGFRGVLGTKVIVLKVGEPEHKGIVERTHDYLEKSFLPGRTFSGPGDFNHQMQHWLQMVNGRRRRVLGCAPTDRIGADRQAMLALPPVPPATGWRSSTRLARDHYIRLDSNDYSDDASKSLPIWIGCEPSATERWSLITSGCGRGIRRSPILSTARRRTCSAATGSAPCGRCVRPTTPRSSSVRSATTTPPWVSTSATAGWCHDHQSLPERPQHLIEYPGPQR